MVSPEAEVKLPAYISQSLAKALANPLRVKILVELNKRVMSPSQFAEEFPRYSLSKVSQHFRQLEKYGCIEEVEQKIGGKRRGGIEHYFQAIRRAFFDQSSWAGLPESIRSGVTGETFTTYIERVAQAIEAGTIDIRDDRHFSWIAVRYDQQAWDEMIEGTDALFERAQELQVEAALRMAESGEEPIPATVAFACFESPSETGRSPAHGN